MKQFIQKIQQKEMNFCQCQKIDVNKSFSMFSQNRCIVMIRIRFEILPYIVLDLIFHDIRFDTVKLF